LFQRIDWYTRFLTDYNEIVAERNEKGKKKIPYVSIKGIGLLKGFLLSLIAFSLMSLILFIHILRTGQELSMLIFLLVLFPFPQISSTLVLSYIW
jgi:hypothetical protein